MPSPKKSSKSNAVSADRKVVYPEVTSEICLGETAITEEKAQALLGWLEEDQVKFGSDYLLKDLAGTKVRCENNVKNRPLYMGNVLAFKQEILRGRWRFNGEPIIVGRTGLLLNGQHTLISLVLAVQEWRKDPEKWPGWKHEPTIDKLIVYGVDEDDEVVNTMDTCKPRSLADVIYRSEYFSALTGRDRRNAARSTDYAIRLMWHRTGAGLDAFAPRRTHAESLDFIARHPRILECVKHITEENGKEGKIARYVSPGYAAGLLYLFGCSGTDTEASDYSLSPAPNESMLNWDRWEKACAFFVLLAGGAKGFSAVRTVLARILEETGGSNAERWAILVSAWNSFIKGEEISEKTLQLEYEIKDGVRRLAECPTVGGIDIGDPSLVDEEQIRAADPSREEIEVQKAKLRKEKTSQAGPKKAKRAGDDWAPGDVAWVREEDGDCYLGTLIEEPYECDDDDYRVMVEGDGGVWEVRLSDLSLEEPAKPMIPPKSGKLRKMPKSNPPAKHKKISAKQVKAGGVFWVQDSGEEGAWRGRVVEVTGNKVRLKVENGFQGAGNVKVAAISDLSADQPSRMA